MPFMSRVAKVQRYLELFLGQLLEVYIKYSFSLTQSFWFLALVLRK